LADAVQPLSSGAEPLTRELGAIGDDMAIRVAVERFEREAG